MSKIKDFERRYAEFIDVLFNRFYKSELSYEQLNEFKKKTFDSTFLLIDSININYEDYLRKELIEVFENKDEGNPFGIKFSDDFKIIYSNRKSKLEFLNILICYRNAQESIADVLVFVADSLINPSESEINIANVEWVLNLIRFEYNQDILIVIEKILPLVNDMWFTVDVGYGITGNLRNYKTEDSFRIIKKNVTHKVQRLAQLFQNLMLEFKEEGLIDSNNNWIGK